MKFPLKISCLFLALGFLLNTNVSAQMCTAPSQADWIRTSGNFNFNTTKEDYVFDVAAHPFLDYFVTVGQYEGNLPGSGLPNTPQVNSMDVFNPYVSLFYAPFGNHLLSLTLPSSIYSDYRRAEYAPNGDLVLVGTIHDPQPVTGLVLQTNPLVGLMPNQLSVNQTLNSQNAIFIQKIRQDGTFVGTHFIEPISSIAQNDFRHPESLSVDRLKVADNGDVYITGSFTSISVNFNTSNTGPDIRGPLSGVNNFFVTKVNADGSYGWTYTYTPNGATAFANQIIYDLAVSSTSNDLWVVGSVSAHSSSLSVDFGTGINPQTILPNAGKGFVLKLDTITGTPLIGWLIDSIPLAVEMDSANDLYVSGKAFGAPSEFAPVNHGLPSFVQNTGSDNRFVIKYSGPFVSPNWFTSFSGSTLVNQMQMELNGCGQIVIMDALRDFVFGDPNQLTLHKFDSAAGSMLWTANLPFPFSGPVGSFFSMDIMNNGELVFVGKIVQTPIAVPIQGIPIVMFKISDNVNPGTPGCDCI